MAVDLPQPRLATVPLANGWTLQSSAHVGADGERLSTEAAPAGGYPITVPSTVFAGLVHNGLHGDPAELFVGMNLRDVPGVSYPIGRNFSNLPMPADSPFAVSWWFRTSFTLPADYAGQTVWLHFGGLNYRANVWLNGRRIAGADELVGAYRCHQLDVTAAARPGAVNVLAVEVFAPTEKDLGITFVDWNPSAPDKGMGLWREVYVSASGPVSLRHPMVATELVDGRAELTVVALVKNAGAQPVVATVRGRIEEITFSEEVSLAAGEEREVVFMPARHPGLVLANPRLWWPAQMGEPHLYELGLSVEIGGAVSDGTSCRFGVRTMRSELNADNKRVFLVNGQKLLVRGAGWASDLMLRYDHGRVEDQLRYLLDMGLNTVRLEGKLEPPHFFETCDRLGILVMAGWCCCDHWEKWAEWKPEDPEVAARSLHDQLARLRRHPSLLCWMNSSDLPPPADVETRYLQVAERLRWPNPTVSSASARPTAVSGETGLKMTGPYEYVPPGYWLEDRERGGAHGFNTETSPGPAVPPVESLRKILPADHLWPIDEVWNFHAGGGEFRTLNVFTEALTQRHGAATSIEDYAGKAQLMAYEGIRAMFEAYSRNKYAATGVIQWMLNNSWPGLIWHLFDYFLRPAGGYFGAKKACAPLHPLYSYDDHGIWVVNSRYKAASGLTLRAQLFDLQARERWTASAAVEVGADGTVRVLALPSVDAGPVSFLRLALTDATGHTVGSNFYWLSRKRETLDWANATWFRTPTQDFADFTALAQLPRVKLQVTSATERAGEECRTRVKLENRSAALAFFVRLQVQRSGDREEILPVLWDDNYVSLLPGETREIVARYRARDLGDAEPTVAVSGFNVE